MYRASFDMGDRPSLHPSRSPLAKAVPETGPHSPRMRSCSFDEEKTTTGENIACAWVNGVDVESASFRATCLADYTTMRRCVPVNMWETTVNNLLEHGLPSDFVKRLWAKRVLWLLVMHPEDITKLHVADLRGKYSHNHLDIVEMRALWHSLTTAQKTNGWKGNNEKMDWLGNFRRAVVAMEKRRCEGDLLPQEQRNPVYEAFDGHENGGPFDPYVDIQRRDAVGATKRNHNGEGRVSEKVVHFEHMQQRNNEVQTSSTLGTRQVEIAALQTDSVVTRGKITMEIKNFIPFSNCPVRSEGPASAEEFLSYFRENKPRKAITSRLQAGHVCNGLPTASKPTKVVSATSPAPDLSAEAPSLSKASGIRDRGDSEISDNSERQEEMSSEIPRLDASSEVDKPPATAVVDSPDPWGWESAASSNKCTPCEVGNEEAVASAAKSDKLTPSFVSPGFGFDSSSGRGGRRDSLQNFDSPDEELLAVMDKPRIADLVGMTFQSVSTDLCAEAEAEAIPSRPDIVQNSTTKTNVSKSTPRSSFTTPSDARGRAPSQARIGFSWGKFGVQRLSSKLLEGQDKENSVEQKLNQSSPAHTDGNISAQKVNQKEIREQAQKSTSSVVGEKEQVQKDFEQFLRDGKASKAKALVENKLKILEDENDKGENLPENSSSMERFTALIGLDSSHATHLLLECVDDPERLSEPLETLMLLVDAMNANVNAVDEKRDDRPALAALFNSPLMGRLLLTRGADPLKTDSKGRDSALLLCQEYECAWIFQALGSSDGFKSSLSDPARLKEYCRQLILGGHGGRAHEHMEKVANIFSEKESADLLASCKQRGFEGMADPMGTFEALDMLGATEQE